MRKQAWRTPWSRSCAVAGTSRSSTARWPTASATTGHGPARPPPATWNDANVLALSLRSTSDALLGEILDAWFTAGPSDDPDDVENVRHLDEI